MPDIGADCLLPSRPERRKLGAALHHSVANAGWWGYGVLSQVPAREIRKTRLSVPPFGIDLFDPPLQDLVLAAVEFDSDEDLHGFRPPDFVVAEVTRDERFRGGRLTVTSRGELLTHLDAVRTAAME